MKPLQLDRRTFRSRVARRVFLVFIVCALLPVTAFAVFSFVQVSRQLERDARAQLRAESKGTGMAILERLVLLDLALRSVPAETSGLEDEGALADGRLRRVFLAPGPGVPEDLRDRLGQLAPATPREREHLAAGRSLLRVLPEPDGSVRLLLVRAAEPERTVTLRIGELEPERVWQPGVLRADLQVVIRDEAGRVLFATSPEAAAETAGTPANVVEVAGARHLREEWNLFLESVFASPSWTVIDLRDEALVFEPLLEFRLVFPLVALLSVGVVVLLAIGQIRRSLVPIETLRAATEQLAARDFEARVDIDTNDEFRDLGEAFNVMAARVGDLTQNLEDKVAARTRELADTLKELRETQAQLVHREKMASVGQFVAGIAHEINNPLAFIKGNLHFLQQYMASLVGAIGDYEGAVEDRDPELRQRFAGIRAERDVDHAIEDLESVFDGCADGVQRTTGLVKDLRTFSRLDDGECMEVDLREALDSTINLLSSHLEGIELSREYADLPAVECLAGQLNQVWMNLIANAADAVEGGGLIRVRTLDLGSGWVGVEVEDDGCGIEAETLEKIFDPFFTTKEIGQGTGLGLSVAYGILQRHSGRIDVRSEPGKGTCVRVELPVQYQRTDAQEALEGPGGESETG